MSLSHRPEAEVAINVSRNCQPVLVAAVVAGLEQVAAMIPDDGPVELRVAVRVGQDQLSQAQVMPLPPGLLLQEAMLPHEREGVSLGVVLELLHRVERVVAIL